MDLSLIRESWRLFRLTWKPLLALYGPLFLVGQAYSGWKIATFLRYGSQPSFEPAIPLLQLVAFPLITYLAITVMTAPQYCDSRRLGTRLQDALLMWGRILVALLLVSLPFLPLTLLPVLLGPTGHKAIWIASIGVRLSHYAGIISALFVIRENGTAVASAMRTFGLVPLVALLPVYGPVLALDLLSTRLISYMLRYLPTAGSFSVVSLSHSFITGALRMPIGWYVALYVVAAWFRFRGGDRRRPMFFDRDDGADQSQESRSDEG